MKSNDPNIRKEIIDGQIVFVPDSSAWEVLLKHPYLDGVLLWGNDLLPIIQDKLEIAKSYKNEFQLCFYSPSKTQNTQRWLFCLLLFIHGRWQRVEIEYMVCAKCGWTGRIANPLEFSLYFGVPDWQAAMKSTSQYTFLSCPQCSEKLQRPAIWIDTKT